MRGQSYEDIGNNSVLNSRNNHDDIKSSCSSIHNNSDCKQLYEACSSFKLGSSLTIKLRLKFYQNKI